MTRSRLFLLALLVTACATQAPRPAPPPTPVEPFQWKLLDVDAKHSQWLDLPARVDSAVGGKTGIRFAWYRFTTKQRGKVDIKLTLGHGEFAGFEVFDSSVVDRPHDVTVFGSRTVVDDPQEMSLAAAPLLYYVKVYCLPGAGLTEYTLAATFTPDVPAPMAETDGKAPPKPRPATDSAAADANPQSPAAPPPAKKPLAAPALAAAIPLSDGTATANIGGDSGNRWVWYRVPLDAASHVRVVVATSGAPVRVELQDAAATTSTHQVVRGSGAIEARLPRGDAYIRVGPASDDIAARVSITVKVQTRQRRPTHTERSNR